MFLAYWNDPNKLVFLYQGFGIQLRAEGFWDFFFFIFYYYYGLGIFSLGLIMGLDFSRLNSTKNFFLVAVFGYQESARKIGKFFKLLIFIFFFVCFISLIWNFFLSVSNFSNSFLLWYFGHF